MAKRCLLLWLLIYTGVSLAQEAREVIENSAIRVVNLFPGLNMLDLLVDGRLRISDVGYGVVSGYVIVPADTSNIAIMPHTLISGTGQLTESVQPPQPLPVDIELEADKYYTIILGLHFTTSQGARSSGTNIMIFENPFEIPRPGQARLRLVNTTDTPIAMQALDNTSREPVGENLIADALSTEVVNIARGRYILSFDDETELNAELRAGILYTFYVFRDEDELVVNVSVDGMIGVLEPGSR
jgi:hypothetical protein